ncbi:uncharacterized protein C8Q71DRAFT_725383 [Rhodofomes roseus]|uniref:Uncharacterized protein n=1 Tax=Rhodofomes roseus TaxID=34475 RepID=A0ABQ8KA02_9APHY|nr:uncharacterized protein C8Q71DRAFT_725383 [Rhodofomes roseus]KAH9834206.1 hypothetical protein C8Q71DRAFT_725383 [Rhodofomes roseus]
MSCLSSEYYHDPDAELVFTNHNENQPSLPITIPSNYHQISPHIVQRVIVPSFVLIHRRSFSRCPTFTYGYDPESGSTVARRQFTYGYDPESGSTVARRQFTYGYDPESGSDVERRDTPTFDYGYNPETSGNNPPENYRKHCRIIKLSRQY